MKIAVDSIRLHKSEKKPRALYNEHEMPRNSENRMCSRWLNRIQYFYRVHLTPLLRCILGVIFGLLTLLVIFFEVSLYLSWDVSGFYESWTTYSYENEGQSFIITNLLCMIPLSYICAASYYGLFKIKVQSVYALHSN